MSDISNQLIKDSYNYVLQSDLSTGNIYRIGGGIPVNPKFLSGLTINTSFNFSNGTEQPGYVLTSDSLGNASWGPISGSSNGNYLSLSGGTVTGPTIFTNGLTANTISATTYQNLPIDIRVTGGTKSGNTVVFINNTGGTFNVTGFSDTFVTGATYSNNTFTYRNNTGGTFNVSFNTMTGLTATTISATTYQNLPIDVRVTGGTYDSTSGATTFTNNTGGTFNVTGYFKPTDDVYVTSGSIGNGPDNTQNYIILNRNNAENVILTNLVDIVTVTKSIMNEIISTNKVIKGKIYKILDCDSGLYLNGTNTHGELIYTTIYLTGLESNKLSESGVGIFYTPKYNDYPIFEDNVEYGDGTQVIWGGYVWRLEKGGKFYSENIFNLPKSDFEILYPFHNSNEYNGTLYDQQYDDIIYDYDQDVIIYRNEQNSNIVSTTQENIVYWIENKSLYNPIKAFKWGHLNVINNQQIINSYNENINYRGSIQNNFYFNNLSYQSNINVDITSYQENFIFNNGAYQNMISLIEYGYQRNFNFTNESFQDRMVGCRQNNVNLNYSVQSKGNSLVQDRITIKNFSRDLTGISGSEVGEFYINDLPIDYGAPVLIGKNNNRLVEVPVGGGLSDLRTKNNIEYITGDTSSIINKLKPAKFEFNNYSGVTRHGFIAQDVLDINPKLVLGDGEKENRLYGLDYYGILALTVKSLQEANSRIDTLEKIVSEYQSK